MFFEQIVRQDIGCASYLVGSTDAGEAAVVDPRLDMVEEILTTLEREQLRLRYIIETHNHADHVSGHHQLAARTGAAIAVHEDAGAAYPHRALRDGDELTLGEVRLRVIHTPGHRPEHIALAAIDTARGDAPWLVLTGDSLFIGDVARPDLAIDGQEGARALYDSLHEQLLGLPEGTMVYPGHLAGSLCGRVNNRMTGTTIGFERRFNPALTIEDAGDFVRYMTASLPERPPNMARIVERNRAAEIPLAGQPQPLDPAQARQLLAGDARVLDVRPPQAFAAGHIPGAVAVPFGSQFQNRLGLVLGPETPLVLVLEDDQQAQAVADALAVIGYDRVAGYLAGGLPAWRSAGLELSELPQLGVSELQERRRSDDSLQILDVREPHEWAEGHIAGARNIPFYRVDQRGDELDPARPLAVICGSGTRSTIAASLLQAGGRTDVINVRGGMSAWEQAGLPTVPGREPAGATAAASEE